MVITGLTHPFELTLNTRVSDIYNPNPLKLRLDEKVTSARKLFRDSKQRIALVVDRYDKLQGVVTRGDILIVTSAKSTALIKDIMSPPLVTAAPDERVADILPRMLSVDEWYVPVTQNGKILGVLGLEQIIQRMLDENKEYLETVRVETIMSKEVVSVEWDDHVNRVWDKMVEYKYAGLPVVDDNGRLVGIITQYDLLAKGVRISLESSSGPARLAKIREVMTSNVVYLYPWDTVEKAASIMVSKGFGRLPVVSDAERRKLMGIVDREDVVRILVG